MGISAIEFLLVLGLASVIFVSAVSGATQRNERLMVNEAARSLQFSLAFARNQAITRRSSVQVCPTDDLVSCSTQGDWSQAWIVLDTDNGEVVRVVPAAAPEIRLVADSGVSLRVQFNELGDAFSTAGDFFLCHRDQEDFAVALRVNAVGEVVQLETDDSTCATGA